MTPRAPVRLPLARPDARAAAPVGAAPPGTFRIPDDVRLRDVRLPSGVRLRCAERGDPAGPATILLHGYSDSWLSFGRLLPLLPRTLHVLAPDLRGHGGSERPLRGYLMRDLAADVLELMDERGVGRAAIVGHSMGAFVAQQVALAAPERVAGLALIGSTTAPRHIAGMYELVAAVHAFDVPDAPVPEAFARAFQASTVHAPLPSAFLDAMVAASLGLPVRVWQALVDGMLATDVPAALADRRIPTLLLWGERDPYALREEQDALLRLLPEATLRAYAGTGHAPHWERPESAARDLAAFLTRLR